MEIQVFKLVASLLFLHPLSIFGARSVSRPESYRTSRICAVATSLEVFRCCFLLPWPFHPDDPDYKTFMSIDNRNLHELTEWRWKNHPPEHPRDPFPCHAAKCLFLLHHSLPVSRLRPPPLWHSRKLKAAVSACRQEHTGAIGFESGYQFRYSLERSYSKSMLKVC